MEKMKLISKPIDRLTFKNANHNGGYRYGGRGDPKYAIDWDKDETHYKTPLEGIRVYAGEDIEINNMGYHNPYWRERFKELTGLEIILPMHSPGIRFKTPDDRPVPKHLIDQNTLLLDTRSQCFFAFPPGWNDHITIRKDMRFPIGCDPILLNMPNPEREVALLKKFENARAVGLTLQRIEPFETQWFYSQAENSIIKEKPPTDFTLTVSKDICRTFALFPKQTTQKICWQARNIEKFEFLKCEYVTSKKG